MNLAQCDEIGCRQDGLITRQQASEVLSKQQIETLLVSGSWSQLYPSVYRMTGVAVTWKRMVAGAILIRPDALASDHTAAFLWGMRETIPRKVELLTQMTRSARLPNVTMHRTRRWHESIGAVVKGIPVTNAARTLINMSTTCSAESIKYALDAGLTKNLFKFDDLMQELDHVSVKGQVRYSALCFVLGRYDSRFEKTQSHKEIDVLVWIKDAGLPEPEPQLKIPVGENDTYWADFAYPEQKIVIESQSWRWHGGPSRHERDSQKNIELRALGWDVIPVLPRSTSKVPFIAALTSRLAKYS